eukprot:m51a1_g13608 hypothetical protein (386) ;mRNA; r:85-2008
MPSGEYLPPKLAPRVVPPTTSAPPPAEKPAVQQHQQAAPPQAPAELVSSASPAVAAGKTTAAGKKKKGTAAQPAAVQSGSLPTMQPPPSQGASAAQMLMGLGQPQKIAIGGHPSHSNSTAKLREKPSTASASGRPQLQVPTAPSTASSADLQSLKADLVEATRTPEEIMKADKTAATFLFFPITQNQSEERVHRAIVWWPGWNVIYRYGDDTDILLTAEVTAAAVAGASGDSGIIRMMKQRHTSPVSYVGFVGQDALASASEDGVVLVHSTTTGRPRRALRSPSLNPCSLHQCPGFPWVFGALPPARGWRPARGQPAAKNPPMLYAVDESGHAALYVDVTAPCDDLTFVAWPPGIATLSGSGSASSIELRIFPLQKQLSVEEIAF